MSDTGTAEPPEVTDRLAASAARWLAGQDDRALRIAREITRRREAYQGVRESERMHESGVIHGLRLALSYLGDRPGDISDTGTEGFIINVESAEKYVREVTSDGN